MEALGAHRATYEPKPERWIGTAVAGTALVLAIVLAVGSGNVGLGVCVALLAAAFAAMTAGKVQSARRGHNAKLALFEHGAVFTGADGRRHTFFWGSVSVLRYVVESRKYGTVVRWHAYTLREPGGPAVVLGDAGGPARRDIEGATMVRGPAFTDADDWGRRIEDAVVKAQLPRAVATVANGAALTFGPITVQRDGVTANGRTVPWSDVEHFRIVYNARFEIVPRGQRSPLVKVPISTVPNFAVLYALGRGLHTVAR